MPQTLLTEPALEAPVSFAAVREDFPIARRGVYLNNASIGPLSNTVRRAVDRFNEDVSLNGREHYPQWCRFADTEIKADLARLIGASAAEIAFVKNTTEGLLLVANGLDWRPGDNVVVSEQEYPSNVYCWMNLARRGVNIRWAPFREGRVRVEDLAERIDSRTRLVTLSGVQFSSGYRLDLPRVSELCRARGVLLNLDMIQHVGALELDVSACPVDFLSAGGHKWMLGPIGTGIFYCRREAMNCIHPWNVGYHSVAKSEDHVDYDLTFRPDAGRFEEALVNFPGLYGLHAAARTLLSLGLARVETHILALNARAVEGLRKRGCRILSPLGNGERSGILTFAHPRLEPEAVAARLKEAGVAVAVRVGGVRISPSIHNDAGDIDAFLAALPEA
ncbi:MAG: aminotransferase class V-fold PLP-dependent enzyme [Planctomycetota bacterium]|nr:aminotransferase class V-fold PLP-dependent enzyme [Planctomycetota bacterium]